MRFLAASVTAIALICGTTALAETPGQGKAAGGLLQHFGTAAGAWYLNQRCQHLSAEAAAKLEKDVGTLNVDLTINNNGGLISVIQQSAKSVAESDEYSCGPKTKEIVENGAKIASELNRERQLSERREDIEFVSRSYGGAQRCFGADASFLAEMKKGYDDTISNVETILPGENFADVAEDYRRKGLAGPKPVCGPEVKAVLTRAKDFGAGRARLIAAYVRGG